MRSVTNTSLAHAMEREDVTVTCDAAHYSLTILHSSRLNLVHRFVLFDLADSFDVPFLTQLVPTYLQRCYGDEETNSLLLTHRLVASKHSPQTVTLACVIDAHPTNSNTPKLDSTRWMSDFIQHVADACCARQAFTDVPIEQSNQGEAISTRPYAVRFIEERPFALQY